MKGNETVGPYSKSSVGKTPLPEDTMFTNRFEIAGTGMVDTAVQAQTREG